MLEPLVVELVLEVALSSLGDSQHLKVVVDLLLDQLEGISLHLCQHNLLLAHIF